MVLTASLFLVVFTSLKVSSLCLVICVLQEIHGPYLKILDHMNVSDQAG